MHNLVPEKIEWWCRFVASMQELTINTAGIFFSHKNPRNLNSISGCSVDIHRKWTVGAFYLSTLKWLYKYGMRNREYFMNLMKLVAIYSLLFSLYHSIECMKRASYSLLFVCRRASFGEFALIIFFCRPRIKVKYHQRIHRFQSQWSIIGCKLLCKCSYFNWI